MSRDNPQAEFDEHMSLIYWMNVARDQSRELTVDSHPPTSPLDAEWREVNRQLDWQESVLRARASRLSRPMAVPPDNPDLGTLLAVFGGELQ